MNGRDDAPYWDLDRYRVGASGGAAPPPPSSLEAPAPGRPRGAPLGLGYDSDPGRLFGIALRTGLLTILTLGLYRFWMITRLRRFYWNAILVDGDPLEYTGTPIEKLLGFLLALVLLALYLGVVNLGLTFAGLSIATEDPVMLNLVLQVSVLATVPLIFYAVYRGQRYLLARTRWRGIRFGLGPGAIGYMLRGVLLSALTLVTLGLAWPYQQFRLAKYVTDRARFGDLAFAQGGSWRALLGHWMQVYLGVIAMGLMVWALAAHPDDPASVFLGTVALSIGGLVLAVMLQRYQVAAFRVLWSHRSLGGARFANDVSAGRVLFYQIGGGAGVGVVTILVALVAAAGGWAAVETLGLAPDQGEWRSGLESGDAAALRAASPVVVLAVLVYLLVFAMAYALSQIFVTSPVLAAKVRAMEIAGVEALTESRQRAHDPAAEAGGFADALGVDIGAGV